MEAIYLTKNDYVYQVLRRQILTGIYVPNQRLALSDLAKSIDTSVMPIRESLRQLQKDGLVKQVPHQGYTVASLSLEEMEELFYLRMALEPLSVRLAIEKGKPGLVELLSGLVMQMEEYIRESKRHNLDVESSTVHREEFMKLNKDFHQSIVSVSGYRHLPSILNRLFDQSERYMNLLEFVVGLEYVDVAEHKEIVSLIEARDKAGATEAMNRHILRVLHELQEHAMARGWTVIQQAPESSRKENL